MGGLLAPMHACCLSTLRRSAAAQVRLAAETLGWADQSSFRDTMKLPALGRSRRTWLQYWLHNCLQMGHSGKKCNQGNNKMQKYCKYALYPSDARESGSLVIIYGLPRWKSKMKTGFAKATRQTIHSVMTSQVSDCTIR